MNGKTGLRPAGVGRRAVTGGLLGVLGAPLMAVAQSRAPACGAVGGEGEITSVTLEGAGNRGESVVSFGQAFRQGDLPAGRMLQARLRDGRVVPTQLDIRNTHPDGSVRLAMVALSVPAMAAGAMARVSLGLGAGAAAPMALESALAGRQAVVEISGPIDRNWRLELLPLLARAVVERPWQSGPLVMQGRVVTPVPAEVMGGVASLRLVADIAIQADGVLRVEAWFRNDVAMRAGGGEARYYARVLLDGREMARFDIRRQFQYTGWGRQFAVGRNGPVATPQVRHDAAYLAETGAVARYDLTTGVDESLLAQMGAVMAAPEWAAPLWARHVTRDMAQTGGRADIGPATRPQAIWLMTGDRRAAEFACGQAEAAGAVPWHYWDPSGGSGAGGWLDARRWPRLWSDGRGGAPPGGLMQPISAETGWVADCAHQPELCFVPYLLTGRRAFLDGLQAQASWCVVSQWPAPAARGVAGGGMAEGLNVVRGNQVRGAAWSLRQLDNAAWASPDDDGNRAYFRTCSSANWAWLRAALPGWSAAQGEMRGCIPGVYGSAGVMPPWQQDYFASTAASAARRGSEDARAVLDWMGNFLAGRFLVASRGFEPHDGAAYLIAARSTEAGMQPLGRWGETGQAMRAAGLSNAGGWGKSEGDYAQLALQSLASLADITGSAEAKAAHAWLAAAGAPFTRRQDYRRDPIFNIVPRCGV